ncbi:MAG TPA: folylpolyglutamate synthase/dihydrofolate synthase family protein [Melioribacteraceae bacterium]|nr:folylpolyglutamate synthase/dihydrofolate synthase family protein [Melioribacteraceae bacterium]
MNIEQILSKIYSLHQFDIKLGLEKITNLLDYLGNPQNSFKSIHIAGSNGKGSTASYISSLLIESGYKVGLYTSPHLVKFNERIRINGIEIEDEYIVQFITDLDRYIKKYCPTFFEITTALAFKYFADKKIEVGVIETGLGGRLDATNVLNPLATVITTISLEHTNILGNDIKQIAKEKGGIIKSRTNCFLGLIEEEAEKILIDICDMRQSNCFLLKNYIAFYKNICNINTKNFNFTIYNPVLKGIHQYYNLSLALLTVNKTFGITNSTILHKGIVNVLKNSRLQGRYEILNTNPHIILEAAHNTESIEAFIEIFKEEKFKYKNNALIFGVMRDKNISEMLTKLKPLFNNFYFVDINYERAEKSKNLIEIAETLGIKGNKLELPDKFISEYINDKQNENNCLIVLGSIYLLGEIKNKLLSKDLIK